MLIVRSPWCRSLADDREAVAALDRPRRVADGSPSRERCVYGREGWAVGREQSTLIGQSAIGTGRPRAEAEENCWKTKVRRRRHRERQPEAADEMARFWLDKDRYVLGVAQLGIHAEDILRSLRALREPWCGFRGWSSSPSEPGATATTG